MTADYSLLDGTGVNGGLKLTATGAMDRSRYRHEPYPRYHSTKVVTWTKNQLRQQHQQQQQQQQFAETAAKKSKLNKN